MSIAEIAEAVDRSKATVRHWLMRYGLKTHQRRGRRPSEHDARQPSTAVADGDDELPLATARREFWLDGRGYYRCRRCRSEAVHETQAKIKATLVARGGRRLLHLWILPLICERSHFHHRDPAEKRLELNAKGIALSLETLRVEARKCVLLCSNCHAEVEDGMALASRTRS